MTVIELVVVAAVIPMIVCDLLVAHVIQCCLAIIEVCHVCGCSIVADDCKAAEETVIDVFAVLKVDAVVSHLNFLQV